MEKFNYQVVFKINDDERIIFAGITTLFVDELLVILKNRVDGDFESYPIENCIYQPLKPVLDESKA